MSRKSIPKFISQGSDFTESGLHAAPDWRYELLVDYLKLSPSYSLACSEKKPLLKTSQLPKDWKKVKATYSDFGNVHKIRESQWWTSVGQHLFGIKAARSEVFVLGNSAEELVLNEDMKQAAQAWAEMSKPNSLLIAIPINQTKLSALRQIREIIKQTEFTVSKSTIEPKYKLLPTKLREHTLAHGVTALKLYKGGMQLWEIGYQLGLSEASSRDIDHGKDVATNKAYLQIMASKLIHKAELIAENAARGRFPSDKSFPGAMLVSNLRKVGRPSKGTQQKRT
jgi:hypothetical protein